MKNQELEQALFDRGFRPIAFKQPDTYLYCRKLEDRMHLVLYLDLPPGGVVMRQGIEALRWHVADQLTKDTGLPTESLVILASDSAADAAAAMQGLTGIWYADRTRHSLETGEGVGDDFAPLRPIVERAFSVRTAGGVQVGAQAGAYEQTASGAAYGQAAQGVYEGAGEPRPALQQMQGGASGSQTDAQAGGYGQTAQGAAYGHASGAYEDVGQPRPSSQAAYGGAAQSQDISLEEAMRRALKSSLDAKVNTALIAINILAFLILSVLGSTQDPTFMLEHGAMYAPEILSGHGYYKIITSMFLHFGIGHIFSNMLLLYAAGERLEKLVGSVRYFLIYMGSGIISALASLWWESIRAIPAVSAGASGAIFGVLGALFYIVLRNRGQVRNLNIRQITILLVFQLYYGFVNAHIDNAAHIGGLIGGIILAMLLYHPGRRENQRFQPR